MNETATNNAPITRGRPFEPGNAGGPGRPEGSRNKATIILDALADGEAEAVLRKVIEAAMSGDLKAAEIVLSRVWPPRKGRGIRIRAGTSRTYYIGVESAMPAVPGIPTPVNALCVVPFGMEEGTHADVPPQEFDELAVHARRLGFHHVASGPFVRSSYHAAEMVSTDASGSPRP